MHSITIIIANFASSFVLTGLVSQPQAFLHIVPHNPLILGSVLSPHPSCIHVCRALVVRLRKHAHNTNEDLLDALYWRPAFGRLLVVVRVIAGRVQNRDADFAVGIHCTLSVTSNNMCSVPS